jgi:lysozyme family protein
MDDPFIPAFTIVVGHEGGYSDEPSDPGNWTSGRVGFGQLRGTKFGISAAAYPAIDIVSLTLNDAQTIYRRDYWVPILGAKLPPRLALLVFDSAVNNGVNRAVRWLQAAVGAEVDGEMGPRTQSAIAAHTATETKVTAVCIEFQAQRVDFMASLPTWRGFGLGWARRLCALPYQSLTMGVS